MIVSRSQEHSNSTETPPCNIQIIELTISQTELDSEPGKDAPAESAFLTKIYDSLVTEKQDGTSSLLNHYFRNIDSNFPESVALIPKADLVKEITKSGFSPIFDADGNLQALNMIYRIAGL